MRDSRIALVLRVVVIGVLVVVTVLATRAVLSTNRRAGDVYLASAAVEGLKAVGGSAIATGTVTGYSNALEDNWAAMDLFLRSNSQNALKDVASHVQASWTAYLVADQLWRMSDEGDTKPLVSQVYAATGLLASQPAFASTVTGQGASARFDNTDLKAVKALFAAAQAEQSVAAVLVSKSITELR